MPQIPWIKAIRPLAGAAVLLIACFTGNAQAETRNVVSISTSKGYARLIFTLPQPAQADVQLDAGVLTIPLRRSVALSVERLPKWLAGYIRSVARADDTLRLMLSRKVRINVMRAGNKLVVDLLPESWAGAPPALPPDITAELARNAKQAPRPPSLPAADLAPAPAPAIPPSRPAEIAILAPVTAALAREGDVLKIAIPFTEPTRAALFRRGEHLWAVFDTSSGIDISALSHDSLVRDANLFELKEGRALRIRLPATWRAGIEADGARLVLSIAEREMAGPRALAPDRIAGKDGSLAVFLPLADAGRLHRIPDPESGETILAVTALPPARGIAREQSLVDFRLLGSVQGLALIPRADDLAIEIVADGVVLSRPGGLRLSDDGSVASIPETGRALYGALGWQVDRAAHFRPREAELIAALAAAAPAERSAARHALARFYLANELGAEAKGALDAASRVDTRPVPDAAHYALRGLALLILGRATEAAEDLARPALATFGEAALIRAAALSAAARFAEARDTFRGAEKELSMLPDALQRTVRIAALRAAIELGDLDQASAILHVLELREQSRTVEPRLAVLAGRLAGRLGQRDAALNFLTAAERSADEAAAAEARLRRVELRWGWGEIGRDEAIAALASLAQEWRGDETEAATQRLLARLRAENKPAQNSLFDPHMMSWTTVGIPGR